MSDKELWELMSIICEGQDSEQRRKVEQYITDLQKEIERLTKQNKVLNEMYELTKKEYIRLNNIINEANKILSNILIVNDCEHKGKYRPVKNTTSQEVYKSVCMLYGILKTPYRSDYGSLQELKGSDKE